MSTTTPSEATVSAEPVIRYASPLGPKPPHPPSVLTALCAVRQAVGAVRKEGFNKHGAYNFRGIDAIVNATAHELVEHGVSIVPHRVVRYETGQVLSGQNRTEMNSARITIRYRVYGPGGDWISAEGTGEAFDSGDKATPKASSVAWRTALLQLLHLPTDEPDPDSYSPGDEQPQPTELDIAKTDAWRATGEKLGYAPAVHNNRVTLLRQAIEAVGGSMESESVSDWRAAQNWIGAQP